MRITDAAQMLGVSTRTLARRAAKGVLTIYRDEHTTIRFVSRAEAEAMLPTAEKDDTE
jgi:predicted site-specific integrase-resolvase